MDTTIPGADAGTLGAEHLASLDTQLTTASTSTVLAMPSRLRSPRNEFGGESLGFAIHTFVDNDVVSYVQAIKR